MTPARSAGAPPDFAFADGDYLDPLVSPSLPLVMIHDAATAIAAWLVSEGRFLPNNAALVTQFCERIVAAGIPLDRTSLHLRALHPQYRGVARIWKRDAPLEERFLDHGIEKTSEYVGSPVRAVAEGRKQLAWRLDTGERLPFAVLEELRDEGYTHYVISPVIFAADGSASAISWATRRVGGFTASDLRFLDELLPSFSSVVEVKALRNFVLHLLTTYVGGEPGRLILDGQVRRGDLRSITAGLMLVDLRDFSMLSDTMSPRAVIKLLNSYFDCIMPPVREEGGEVLEIMGDGILAIFHQGEACSAAQACGQALAAAQKGLAALAEANRVRPPGMPELRAGIALHYGTVSYGNIGADGRLDFTVIGPDVNLTSRIERLCRELDRTLIMSEAFAATLDRPMWEIGHFEMRGFSRMQRLYELPPEGN